MLVQMVHDAGGLQSAPPLTPDLARRDPYLHDEPVLQRVRNFVTSKKDLLVPVQLPASQPSRQSGLLTRRARNVAWSETHILSTLPTVWSSRWIVSVAAFSIFVSLTHDTLQVLRSSFSRSEGHYAAFQQVYFPQTQGRERDWPAQTMREKS